MPKKTPKKTIVVNRQVIAANKKEGKRTAPLSCKVGGKTHYGRKIIIRAADGSEIAKLVYDPEHPQGCGATVWLETSAKVEVIDLSSQLFD